MEIRSEEVSKNAVSTGAPARLKATTSPGESGPSKATVPWISPWRGRTSASSRMSLPKLTASMLSMVTYVEALADSM